MKILVVQPYLNLMGGVERVILNIARHYDAPIYTMEYSKGSTFKEFRDLDIRTIGREVPASGLLPHRASQGLRYGYNFYNMKLDADYDVINAHISPSEWIRHRNKRVLWYCHTPPREVYDLYETRMQYRPAKEKLLYAAMAKVYKVVAKRVVKNIEEIATNSTVTEARIEKYFYRHATVINPGIDAERFSSGPDHGYFLYPSRILVNKRQEYVINAYRRFVSMSKNKRMRLVIAGTLSKDPEHLAYYKRIRRLAEGLNVSIMTNINDSMLRRLYSNSTAVLFSAMNEDYGIVPLEGMASSKPVISVDEGGPRETVLEGKTGFLVKSELEMAKMMKLVADDKGLAEELGRNGRRRVSANYTWSVFFKKFDVLLKKVAQAEA